MASSKTITWVGNPSTDIPELVIGKITRQMIGTVRSSYVDVPGKDGAWYFGDKRGRRKLTAECFIMVEDFADRRAAVEAVANWFDVEIQARLEISDEPGVYYEATVLEQPEVDEWRDTGIFDLVWSINPYALDNNITEETWVSGINTTHSWNPLLEVLTYPVIEITPTNGTLTGFTLTTNDDALGWSGLVNDDATLTINSIAAVVVAGASTDSELTGAYDPLALSMAGVNGKFPVLLPGGTNVIQFTKTGGTATSFSITVSFRKRYRK